MIFFIGAILFIVVGHLLKTLRWKSIADVYEKTDFANLGFSLSMGYLVNFFIPFRIGDLARSYLAGRKMKNGVSFALATVIWDRFLDVIAVGLIFMAMYLFPVNNPIVSDSAFFYLMMGIGLCVLALFAFTNSGLIKKIIKKISWIFNEKIELTILFFFWSLISSFKEILYRVNKLRLLLISLGMWGCYLCSYALLASFVGKFVPDYKFLDVFLLLFARENFDSSSAEQAGGLTGGLVGEFSQMQLIMAAYLLITIVAVMLIARILRKSVSHMSETEDVRYLLPQIESKDRLQFLVNYFEGSARDYMGAYLNMNRNIQIVRDYSAGSKATTMLCMDDKRMFFRKYIMGKDSVRLKNQIDWICRYQDTLPLPEVYQEEYKEDESCFYDMAYNASAVDFFSFIHSNPFEKSWSILKTAIDTLTEKLYNQTGMESSVSALEEYVDKKVLRNIDTIKKAREIQNIAEYDEIVINGKKYRNLSKLESYFGKEALMELFADDPWSCIHGDLTIENIIATDNKDQYPLGFYYIDPNTENDFSSYFLDYAKLLQSLHGKYEFFMNVQAVQVSGNQIQMMLNPSVNYDALYEKFATYLKENLSEKQVKSIFYHEVIHWLRLMPYKLEKNGKNAVIFYAGMIMVMNDVIDMFEN